MDDEKTLPDLRIREVSAQLGESPRPLTRGQALLAMLFGGFTAKQAAKQMMETK